MKMKNLINILIISLFLGSCNDYSIIEGIEPVSTPMAKLTLGSFINPPPDVNYSIQYTTYVKSDFGTGAVEIEYKLEGYNISKKATISKYHLSDPKNCQQATESTVVLDLTSAVASNPNLANNPLFLYISGKAKNGKVFTKRVQVKINFCYWYNIEEFEFI